MLWGTCIGHVSSGQSAPGGTGSRLRCQPNPQGLEEMAQIPRPSGAGKERDDVNHDGRSFPSPTPGMALGVREQA
jgi:hypothetical protein